jgi:3-phenylpropionate/trans-cinnamate dioxygenase ferredoxin reductase subunit
VTSVVIAGGGLAALRVAESLRQAGYAEAITVIGDEAHLPYNRPPLSKEALKGGVDVAELVFRRKPAVDDVTWLLGQRIVAADLASGHVELADGADVVADGLVVATGIRPRRLPIPGATGGRVALRTADDAIALRALLLPGTTVIIMGAGFVGCETAATARALGCAVHVVALDEEPMVRPLGAEVGAAMRRRHEAQGVHFHLGHTIDAVNGDEHVESVSLSDGTQLPADVVIEAVGSVPNVEWLSGNGLDLTDGVLVDDAMRVSHAPLPMVAAGDVARHPNALFGSVPRRVEHWNMPTETGRRAGRTLAALMAGQEPDLSPFTCMPSFWSDQYDYQLQSFGMPGLATRVEVVSGSVDGDCIVSYADEHGLVGVLGIDRTPELAPYRAEILARGNRVA